MIFTSFNYLLFFSIVLVLYNIIKPSFRVWFLLLASYFFYVSLQPAFALLLALITLLTYFFASFISKTESENKKKGILRAGIILLVIPLLFYKYFIPVNELVISVVNILGFSVKFPDFSIILPVGISYYTFMAIGYLVDIYNEEVNFEKNIASTGLFISFFPIVLSGPIERANNLFSQFKVLRDSTYEDLVTGARIIIWGYFMKLCVADNLGIYIDSILNDITNHNGLSIAFASLLYPFQVYGDLGGYSLIAIGSARCMGIKVIANFNRPFLSITMSDFWRRWHMSLIQWLTDYIYTPLSFSLRRFGVWGIVFALLLTFFISGIWHGATISYILWGLVQGIFLSVEAMTKKQKTKIEKKLNLEKNFVYNFISIIFVFVLFAFSLLIVRNTSLAITLETISKIFTGNWNLSDLSIGSAFFGLISLIILLSKDVIEEFYPSVGALYAKSSVISSISVWVLIFYILMYGALGNSQFIYFQF